MTDQLKRTVADIALLYELSLAVGSSLDLKDNADRFLKTLMARKNLAFCALWLKANRLDAASPEPEAELHRLVHALPEAHIAATTMIPAGELETRLAKGEAFSFENSSDTSKRLGLPGRAMSGTTAIWPLGDLGFLEVHAAGIKAPLSQRQLRQLESVVEKFAVSVAGCLSHGQMIHEVREREVVQAQLHHAQKMDAIGRLAGGVAHDFNNLLTGILGCAEILADSSLSAQDRELLDTIESAANSAADLTGQLLAFSRRGQLQSLPVDMSRIIGQVLTLLSRTLEPRISVATDIALASHDTVLGDAGRLQTAILNLALNARDAISGDGEIEISAEVRSLDWSEPDSPALVDDPAVPEGQYIVVRVRDTGSGMSPDISARVFEPFFTTKRSGRGTGLGLAAVYGIAKGHKGFVSVESEPGLGSTFSLYLPLHGEPAMKSEVPPPMGKGEGVILLVDDEPQVRLVESTLCERLGYETLTAEGGAHGLELLRQANQAGSLPRLVILDIQMPKMSGRQTLEAIRQDYPQLPVVIASGFGSDHDLEAIRALGVQGFLEKPFGLADLSKQIRRSLSQPTDA